MIAPHKCFLITYLLIAQFVEQIVNLQEIKKKLQTSYLLNRQSSYLFRLQGSGNTRNLADLVADLQ
jgi:hypothetical protein